MNDNDFGTIFADGKIINLNSASIEDVERCMDNVSKMQQAANNKLNEIYYEIENG